MAGKTKPGFAVICPFCHDKDAMLSIDLANLSSITCQGCDETFHPEQARDMVFELLQEWEQICKWVDAGREFAAK